MSNTKKGFTIVITDNETGNELVNYTDAECIIGGIHAGDVIHSICFVHGSPVDVAEAITACQKSIDHQIEEHPKIEFIRKLLASMQSESDSSDDE